MVIGNWLFVIEDRFELPIINHELLFTNYHSSNQDGPYSDYSSNRHIGRVVAGVGRVPVAGGAFAIDEHRGAPQDDLAAIGRRHLEWTALRDVWRCVRRCAVKRGGVHAHDLDVIAQAAVDDPAKGVRQRRWHRPAWRWNHNDVR